MASAPTAPPPRATPTPGGGGPEGEMPRGPEVNGPKPTPTEDPQVEQGREAARRAQEVSGLGKPGENPEKGLEEIGGMSREEAMVNGTAQEARPQAGERQAPRPEAPASLVNQQTEAAAADGNRAPENGSVPAASTPEAAQTPPAEAQPTAQVEADLKARMGQLADEIRKTAPAADLENSINDLTSKLGATDGEIKEIDEKIANATEPAEKARLMAEKLDKVNGVLEIRQNITKDREALVNAKQRELAEAHSVTKADSSEASIMSDAEFDALTPKQQQAHLTEAMRAVEAPTKDQFEMIAQKMESGAKVSVAERAQYANEVASRMSGGEGYSLKDLQRMNVKYPEVGQAVMDKISNSEAFQKWGKEKFPSNWEKVLKGARGKAGLLMLLILIFGGVLSLGAKAMDVGVGENRKL